jgi:hypothetical protein
LIIITMPAPQLPPMPVDDFEEFMVMDEYTRSNLRDMILQNRDIFGKIQKEKPKLVASLKNGFIKVLFIKLNNISLNSNITIRTFLQLYEHM